MVIYLVDYTFPNERKFAHFMRRRAVVIAVTLRASSAPASDISMNGNLIFVINRNNETLALNIRVKCNKKRFIADSKYYTKEIKSEFST